MSVRRNSTIKSSFCRKGNSSRSSSWIRFLKLSAIWSITYLGMSIITPLRSIVMSTSRSFPTKFSKRKLNLHLRRIDTKTEAGNLTRRESRPNWTNVSNFRKISEPSEMQSQHLKKPLRASISPFCISKAKESNSVKKRKNSSQTTITSLNLS